MPEFSQNPWYDSHCLAGLQTPSMAGEWVRHIRDELPVKGKYFKIIINEVFMPIWIKTNIKKHVHVYVYVYVQVRKEASISVYWSN